jgi:hypothetical protein
MRIHLLRAPEVALRQPLVWQPDPLAQKLMALSSPQVAGTISLASSPLLGWYLAQAVGFLAMAFLILYLMMNASNTYLISSRYCWTDVSLCR